MNRTTNASHEQPFLESSVERNEKIEQTRRIFAAIAADSTIANSTTTTTTLTINNNNNNNNKYILRRLRSTEMNTLESSNCHCHDWSNVVWLMFQDETESTKDHSQKLSLLISDTTFSGVVVIGIAGDEHEEKTNSSIIMLLPPGIHNNTLISNCILDPFVRVYRNGVISDTHIYKSALLMNCGHVYNKSSCSFSYNQLSITVGAEASGGRPITTTPESTMMDVCRELIQVNTKKVMNASSDSTTHNIIGPSCVVRDTPTITNIYMSSNSSIIAATSVTNAVLLPHGMIEHGCIVQNVFLQWNACINNHSSINNTLLMEQAHVGSTTTHSILGPDTHVSCGEVHHSVLGPNTNAHHQSLVISTLNLLGRNNYGYGANVGSNHTGRLADQECFGNEGVFWGLSVCIKFPTEMSSYSIVAAGCSLPPQRVTMPFSLIVESSDQSNKNDILPGWVLQNSPYTISRSEAKFANRRKAKRHDYYTGWSIIRPSTIDLCWAARDALMNASDREVIGIGKSHLTERARQSGIVAYTQCIQRYALHGLLEQCSTMTNIQEVASRLNREIVNMTRRREMPTAESLLQEVKWPTLPWEEDGRWQQCLSILLLEFPLQGNNVSVAWLVDVLGKLVALEHDYAERVYDSKKRDDVRGSKTIPGYASAHVAAEEDSVVVAAKEYASKTEETVNRLVGASSETSSATVVGGGGDTRRSRL